MAGKEKTLGLTTAPSGTWVQVERETQKKWAELSVSNPRAASVLHVIVAEMGRHNALVVSQKNLARMTNCSRSTLQRALDVLKKQNWIEVRNIGPTGTSCAYIVNDRVAWTGSRDGIRYSLFSAAVLISEDEQTEEETDTALNKTGVVYASTDAPSRSPRPIQTDLEDAIAVADTPARGQ